MRVVVLGLISIIVLPVVVASLLVAEVPVLLVLFGIIVLAVAVAMAVRRFRRRATQYGQDGIDAEKREAAENALGGMVLCLLGIHFFPLMLVGLFPLYFGARKLIFLGLGVGPRVPPVEREPQRSEEV